MDTSAAALMHDIGAILDDHKSEIIDMVKEDAEEALVIDVEANLDRMITEIKGLFSSSYSFNK
jgi:predicted HD phosphohydrolase